MSFCIDMLTITGVLTVTCITVVVFALLSNKLFDDSPVKKRQHHGHR